MDQQVNDDQRMLLDTTARFIDDTYPLSQVRSRAHDDVTIADGYRRQAAAIGWFSLVVPEALGGGTVSGNGVVDAALVAHERGKTLQPGPFVGTNVVARTLALVGSDEQQAEVLPALMNGESSATWAITGHRKGVALGGVVEATAVGDRFRLDGVATFVDDTGPGGWILVTAASDAGVSQFLVSTDHDGVSVEVQESLDISRRRVDVHFDAVTLPASALVGPPGGAADIVADQLALACVLATAESVGAMDHEFEMTVAYAKDRVAFGRPIGSFQAIKHLLADTSLDLEMSKAITTGAAEHVGDGNRDHGLESASMAKAFVGDCGIELAQNCFQVFGGIGFTWEHDQHLYLRRLTTDAAWFGDSSWHRERLCQLADVGGERDDR